MQAKQTTTINSYERSKNGEGKSVANKFIDNGIGSVAKISLPELPTVAKDSKRNVSNVKPKRIDNVQNNVYSNFVIDPRPKTLYSSRNPEPSEQGCDYAGDADYEQGSD